MQRTVKGSSLIKTFQVTRGSQTAPKTSQEPAEPYSHNSYQETPRVTSLELSLEQGKPRYSTGINRHCMPALTSGSHITRLSLQIQKSTGKKMIKLYLQYNMQHKTDVSSAVKRNVRAVSLTEGSQNKPSQESMPVTPNTLSEGNSLLLCKKAF